MRRLGGEMRAALSGFAVLFGAAAAVFGVVFLLSLWWVDLVVAAVFALVAVALWQLSVRVTTLAPTALVRLDGPGSRRRTRSPSRTALRPRRRRRS